MGSGALHEQPVPLSQLIDIVNERFGTDFNQADQLFFDQIVEAAMGDDDLRRAAAVNSGDEFELLFRNVLERLFVDAPCASLQAAARRRGCGGPLREVRSSPAARGRS